MKNIKMPLMTLQKETSKHLYQVKFLDVPLDWLHLEQESPIRQF